MWSFCTNLAALGQSGSARHDFEPDTFPSGQSRSQSLRYPYPAAKLAMRYSGRYKAFRHDRIILYRLPVLHVMAECLNIPEYLFPVPLDKGNKSSGNETAIWPSHAVKKLTVLS